jgi:AcrR family transcriptional regulator
MSFESSRRPPAKRPSGRREQGRPGQRRRTRQAIIDAATVFLARGASPSVQDVARQADVSRRTIYMHFPTFEQLLIDASVALVSQTAVDRALARARADDVGARVEALARSTQRMSPELERLGRMLIRLTVASPPGAGRGSPRRGFRRVEWIETALAPLRGKLNRRRFERLVSAIAMVIGWEALVVQRDVRGLTAAEGEALSVWAAHALLDAAMKDAS